ncbi:unnamed protein product [Cochlearia groenlandica]
MSKKKVGGSTMTLKDFHGGSIPSDLPLPSAPGVIPKVTTDRSVFDRAPFGASITRQDQRTRQSSSHSVGNFDDRSMFLPHTVNIGRNFNEDERKPLDGYSGPRRMVSDDVFRVANSRLEVKADSALTGRHSGWSAAAGSFHGIINDVTCSGENSVLESGPNVWTERKEVSLVANREQGQCPWTTQPGVSNLAHGSVPEQGSSGRWQTKLLAPSQIGFDVVKHSEIEGRGHKTNGPALLQADETPGAHVERGLVNGAGVQGGKNFSREYGDLTGPPYFEAKEQKSLANSSNKPHANYSEERPPGRLVQPTGPSVVVERPKLNLLPRTKPIESVVKPLNDGILNNGAANPIQRDTTQKSINISKPGLSPAEISNQPIERPKLNLKPLTQKPEQPDVKPGKERSAVFGGARPREQVLKERGIDETEHHELEQPLERLVLKPVERVLEHATQRPMITPRNLRTRKLDQKDGRNVSDTARSETQSRKWRENDTKSSRQQQQTQEKTRHPSPETWRKPTVLQKPESADRTGPRHGKAASALELAQAYSPFSHPTLPGSGPNSFNTSRNRNNQRQQQQPFSRLVGSTTTTTTRQINGYY